MLDSQQELVFKERRAMEKIWKTREAAAQRAVMSLSAISGDITGLLGSDMPSTGLLELDEIVPDAE